MARAASGLCRALARRGHEVTVATALLDAEHSRDEQCGGVRVCRFPGPSLLNRWLFPWGLGAGRFLRDAPILADVVHLHGHRNGLAVTASRALAGTGTPMVLTPAGTFPHHGQRRLAKLVFDRLAGSRIFAAAAAVVAVSEAEARDLPRSAVVIPNGVSAPGLPQQTAGRNHGRQRLLYVGTDRPQKRGHMLPRVLSYLPPNVELQLVGSRGSALLERFARGAPVRALGVLEGDALATAYAGSDVVLHPAVGEAFGLVPFEAALVGTPSVVAGGHGCGDWFGRAGGCVVPPDDAAAMGREVAIRLADPGLRASEARAVAGFTRRELTWDRAAQAVEDVYREVVAARTPRRAKA
jgi:glycosyltransferase involved in cell wall biosynthesis